ncbi:MAG: GNAT family N-acetyltransferase [Nitrospira sp. SCN 59-13]|mgnify:CR=1 FL=1|nr:MAG: GNAT family N-acetyltransferase [Nitrospira sp. SCN 59-13]
MPILIRNAVPSDAPVIARLVDELLQEIMVVTGAQAFHASVAHTETCVRSWLTDGAYTILLACEGDAPCGFLALAECRALYVGGLFGIIPELYVRPDRRSQGVGRELVREATRVARSKNWARLEVATPPLPQFDRTLAFYERQGFSVSGGRKMKVDIR